MTINYYTFDSLMKFFVKAIPIIILLALIANNSSACSMCKITKGNRTFVGNNEDAWGLNPKIWFESATTNTLGIAFLGHKNGFPQGGMNEAGLAYDGFTLLPKENMKASGTIPLTDISQFVRQIMQQCKTVADVEQVASRYNRSPITGAMFFFVDATGNYIVVEADTLIRGDDPNYVLVNFRPSETPNPEQISISRYRKGVNLLHTTSDTSLSFCASVMDTMKACRGELGDGTLYTSVYDLNKQIIRIYFYHSYTHYFDFKLEEELKKGNHEIYLASIFPKNAEYIKLESYVTPINNKSITYLLAILSLITLVITGIMGIKLFKKIIFWSRNEISISEVIMLVVSFLMNSMILLVIPILFLREPVFYFGIKGSIAAYPVAYLEKYPFVISVLFLITSILLITQKIRTLKFPGWLITLNLLICLIYLILFHYWNLIV